MEHPNAQQIERWWQTFRAIATTLDNALAPRAQYYCSDFATKAHGFTPADFKGTARPALKQEPVISSARFLPGQLAAHWQKVKEERAREKT